MKPRPGARPNGVRYFTPRACVKGKPSRREVLSGELIRTREQERTGLSFCACLRRKSASCGVFWRASSLIAPTRAQAKIGRDRGTADGSASVPVYIGRLASPQTCNRAAAPLTKHYEIGSVRVTEHRGLEPMVGGGTHRTCLCRVTC